MKATYAIVGRTYFEVRHTYCDDHFREALAQCPLTAGEKVTRAKPGEWCEECPLPGDTK